MFVHRYYYLWFVRQSRGGAQPLGRKLGQREQGRIAVTVALDSTPVSSHITVEGEARKMEADANTPT